MSFPSRSSRDSGNRTMRGVLEPWAAGRDAHSQNRAQPFAQGHSLCGVLGVRRPTMVPPLPSPLLSPVASLSA